MKIIILILATTLLTASCVSIDGKMSVNEKINLKIKSGILNLDEKDVEINKQDYIAHFKTIGTNDYILELEHESDKYIIPIKSENNLNIPKFDGKFKISQADIGQPYDIKGNLATHIQDSATVDIVEGCSWYTQEVKCNIVCNSNFKNLDESLNFDIIENEMNNDNLVSNCHRECHETQIPHPGSQNVVFHYTTTLRDLTFDFLKKDSDVSVAKFVGGDTVTQKVIEHTTICL